jgi:uncharacterized protein
LLAAATKPIEAPPPYEQHLAEQFTISARVTPLAEGDKQAALDFLSARPIHTVIIAGWIREHGIENPRHRGIFYGYWNSHGILEGVALIGQVCMFETRSDAALSAFAELARQESSVRLLFAEDIQLEKFWHSYKRSNQEPRVLCHELLYEKVAEPLSTVELLKGLRKARPEELGQVAAAHAQMIIEETGQNPLDKDSDGFHQRCALRIEEGKVWVLIEEGELIFKADVVAETPEAVYAEGLWVNPQYRRKGYGQLCWEALNKALLSEKTSLCGFVNEENESAKAFYGKVGCRVRARFDKMFV